MAEACAFFETPITGGNVSLYNETLGEAIYPSPVVGIVGLMKTATPTTIDFKNAGRAVVLVGGIGTCDAVHFGGTQYVKQNLKDLWGMPPVLDMDYEKRVQAAIRRIVVEGLAESAHDLGDGGLAVALAESAHSIGARIELDSDLRPEFLLFHEGPSRILISTADLARVQEIASEFGVEAPQVGVTIEGWVEVKNRDASLLRCSTARLRELRETSLGRLLHAR
jgi:phosphoribosylformylglycinamidine synthase